ncbi:ATP-binding cassette domain-containing protein [Agromyces intestinalis]|uniref:ATP-binding cassette domain-containing protein n=1 Tax=Agromyces intestinalis TaxID=2592652 RepID=UPI001FE2B6C7|nr:ATP-binding cassette domain-containing protein [Agromyces intestinalis]
MLRFRPEALRTAALLAVAFVVFRVAYRVLFDGAGGSGFVLLDLPEMRLPAPFGHVVLFGDITVDGLARAVAGALPIALVIVAFGVLNAIVDVSRLFARGARRGPVRGIARALVIAWATFPGLGEAVRSVQLARRLRGERGAASLLVPVFERTVERAVAVAAAMEVRGFAAAHRVEGACERPVEVRGARISRGGTGAPKAAWALEIDELVLAPGTLTVVAGPTGSGKSTLLDGLSGLLSHVDGGTLSGTVRVGGVDRATALPRDTAGFVGVVLQNPRLGFAAETVDAEIGFALDVRGVAPAIVASRVAEIAGHVGIAHLLGRDIRALSAGEATLVAIAAALVERPSLLLVDEPLADLDADARGRIVALLDRLAHEAGVCVVVAEHRVAALAGVADGVVSTSRPVEERPSEATTRLEALATQRSSRGLDRVAPLPTRPAGGRDDGGGEALLRVSGLSVRHGTRDAVVDASLEVAPGEVVALAGPNGAGKSSLLTAIALPRDRGTVEVDGADVARLDRGQRRRAVVLVPEASDDLLLALTAADECRHADRAAHARAGATAARFLAFLGLSLESPDGLRRLAAHPRDLSAGERRLLALAIQLAAGARAVMVDEPTRGLDDDARSLVAGALAAVAEAGGAVVIATHDRAFAAAVADRVVTMSAGRVGASGSAGAEVAESRDALRAPRPATPTIASRAPATRSSRPHRRPIHPLVTALALTLGNVIAAIAFAWPFFTPALPSQAQAAAPFAAIALTPFLLAVILLVLDDRVRSAKLLAMLGTLTAVGAAVRIASTGVGGVEAVFVLLLVAGRAFGARFGFLLGVLVIALSSVVQGGVGPWTPFQMFACAWVGAGAGLLPGTRTRAAEIALLSVYGVVASYVFGLAMNLWFWPFAVGAGTAISYDGAAPFTQNLGSFLLYSFVTSTAGWDTLRAITTVMGLVVAGPAVLAALRRTKLTPMAGSPTPRRARQTQPPRGRPRQMQPRQVPPPQVPPRPGQAPAPAAPARRPSRSR